MNKSVKKVVIIFLVLMALVVIGFAVFVIVFKTPQLRDTMGIEPTQNESAVTQMPIQSPNPMKSVDAELTTPAPTPANTTEAPVATPEQMRYAEYILPDSATRRLDVSELNGMDADTARFARNEIYARHRYTFNDSQLSMCFFHKSWYAPTPSVNSQNPPKLNSEEEYNVKLIKEYEQMLKDGKVFSNNPSKANYEVKELLPVLRKKFETADKYYIKSFDTKDGKLELKTIRCTIVTDMRGAFEFVLKNFGLSPSEVLNLPIMKEHFVYYDAADRMLAAEDGIFDFVIEQKEMPPLTLSPDTAITVVDLENVVDGNVKKTVDEYKAMLTQATENGNEMFGVYMELKGNTIVKLDEIFHP